ncbi:MAG: hypothetical protein LQ337_000254 [Flavoplaca oasis]|nr:MAG: hypothetical protein LQ337_000254 [Flavoplaca oasis]
MTVRVTVRVATGALNERSSEFGKAEVRLGLGKDVELEEPVDDEVDAVSPFGLVDVADICEPEVVEDDEVDEVDVADICEPEVVEDDEIDEVDLADICEPEVVEDDEIDEVLMEDAVLNMEDRIEDTRLVVATMDDVERLVEDLVLDKELYGLVAGFVRRVLVLKAVNFVKEIPVEP